jgi:hypothetical protein
MKEERRRKSKDVRGVRIMLLTFIISEKEN